MSYIQREINNLKALTMQPSSVRHYEEFKAALMALEWAIDPVANRSPIELIKWNDDREISDEMQSLFRAGGIVQSCGGVVAQAQ